MEQEASVAMSQNLTLKYINHSELRPLQWDGNTAAIAVKREYGKTPNGNDFNGFWVYRDAQGKYIDHDRYLNDLCERQGFKIE